MRAAFSDSLVRMAKSDPKVLLLTGDHGYALFDDFRKNCPDQYINAGIAEQNMVGMAAGLARAGYIPFVYGLSAFIPIRVLEQIKIDIAHDNLHVVLLGDGAGFVYSHLGTSHQSTEDISATRAIPNLTILSPADRYEQEICMEWAYNAKNPVYLRMGKADRGDVHANKIKKFLGAVLKLKQGDANELAFIATGSMVRTALELAANKYPHASVYSMPSIKPVNYVEIAEICRTSKAIVTFEEHATAGGIGSLVAEVSTDNYPVRVLRIGVEDKFSEHCGSYEYLLKEHGIDLQSVGEKVDNFVKTL